MSDNKQFTDKISLRNEEKIQHESINRDLQTGGTGKRKKPKKKRPLLLRIFLWLLFIIFGIGCIFVYLGLTHPFFNVENIVISGNVKNPNEAIINACKFKVGDNIFLISTKESATNISKLPGIKSVNIKTVIPNAINITVKEDFVMAYVKSQEGGVKYIIDSNGIVSKNNRDGIEDLIELKGIDEKKLAPGMDISLVDEKVSAPLLSLKDTDFYSTIKTMDFSDNTNIILTTITGIKVSFGDSTNSEEKMKVLSKLFEQISTKGIKAKEIIMNVGENPVIVTEDENRQ